MPDIATVARGALDRFVLDLVQAGFQTTDGRRWRGPIDASLADLTSATTMTFVIDDGWPYRHPHVYVDGLRPSDHLQGTALCLWRVGDDSLAWLRLDDLRARLARWADRYRERSTAADPILDPHLYWTPRSTTLLATVDLSKIPWGDGGSGTTTAELKGSVLKIGEHGDLKVRWYGREGMPRAPVNMSMLTEGLKESQANNLARELERVGTAGGRDVLMLVWNTPVGEPNVLVLRLSRDDNGVVRGEALEVARTDQDVLIRRAGPDAGVLRTRSVIVFGQGAIGSNLSLVLARSGLGKITVVDAQRLRPGDLVRHAGIGVSVGDPKVRAVSLMVMMAAPWTEVREIQESPWNPDAIARAVAGTDLVIDAVGEESFTAQMSRRLADDATPMLSVALYRGGAIARVRVRAAGGTPFHDRSDAGGFSVIPEGPTPEPFSWETGCADPVNNAPPASVASAAALATRVAIEVLMGRERGNFDVVEAYQPVENPPFDGLGYRRYDG